MAGTMILGSNTPPQPEQGTQPSLRQKVHRSAGTLTMTGIDMSTRAMVTAVGSSHLPCLWAMKKPMGRPNPRLITMAAMASWAETHILRTISSRTGWPRYL